MLRTLSVRSKHWPLSTPFRISRGVKTVADVVAVTLVQDGQAGRGEAVPYARYGETLETVLAQVNALGEALAGGLTRQELAERLDPGAARNAIDCALWDLEARLGGRTVAEALGQPPLDPLVSAQTVSLDTPQAMGEAITRVLQDKPLRDRLIEAGRERIALHHSPIRRAQHIVGLYDAVLG